MSNTPRAQNLRAIDRANHLRPLRAEVKRQVREGVIDALPLLRGDVREWEDTIAGMRLHHLLTAIPGIGVVTCEEICHATGVRADGRVAELSYVGRMTLARYVAEALQREEE